jgi:hypothetical protein
MLSMAAEKQAGDTHLQRRETHLGTQRNREAKDRGEEGKKVRKYQSAI